MSARQKLMANYGSLMVDSVREFSTREYTRAARRFKKIYQPPLVLFPGMKVLDVGCGDGHYLYYLQEQGCADLTGIDSSQDRLDRCQKQIKGQFECADAFQWLENCSNQYDLVVCNHMIEHFTDEPLFYLLELLVKVTKKGGSILLTTPNACTPWAGYNHYSDLTHVRLFTPESLTQLLSLYGLTSTCYPEAAVPYDAGTFLRWVLWKIREVFLKLDFRIQVGGTRGRQKTPFLVSPNIFAIAQKS